MMKNHIFEILRNFQFSGFNITNTIEGMIIKGFTVYATSSSARVIAKYNNGNPAIIRLSEKPGT